MQYDFFICYLGSPADKDNLEVGDEILEVNGKTLEDATHTEVINHIHQCIRSRTICLRVKRRSGARLGKLAIGKKIIRLLLRTPSVIIF